MPYHKIQFISKYLEKYELPEKIKDNKKLFIKKNLVKYLTDLLYVENSQIVKNASLKTSEVKRMIDFASLQRQIRILGKLF